MIARDFVGNELHRGDDVVLAWGEPKNLTKGTILDFYKLNRKRVSNYITDDEKVLINDSEFDGKNDNKIYVCVGIKPYYNEDHYGKPIGEMIYMYAHECPSYDVVKI